MGQVYTTYTNFSSPPNFGFWYIEGTGDAPFVNGASHYYCINQGLGLAWSGAGSYGMQIGIPRNVANPYISIRYNENNSLGTWQKISAGQADKLTTARTINGVAFDGTADITISAGGSSQWITNGTSVYYNGGNVGIGLVSPSQMLHLQKAGADNFIKIEAGDTNSKNAGVLFTEHNLNYGFNIRYNAGSDKLLFSTQNSGTDYSDKMTITYGGSVGIGTTAPEFTLDVNGGQIRTGMFVIDNAKLVVRTDGTGNYTRLDSYDIPFVINSISNQNVGIGTTNPAYKLDINGSTYSTTLLCNKVGINNTNPLYMIDVNGDINMTGTLRKNGVDLLIVSKLVNQHYEYSSIYINPNTLRTYAINVSTLASFGSETARIYDLNISGMAADYGLSTEVIGSYRIFHSNYAGGKFKKITLYEQYPAGTALNVSFVNGSVITFNTINRLFGDIYTSVSIVN